MTDMARADTTESETKPANRIGAFAWPLAMAAGGGAALGLLAFGWLRYGELIYLTRLAAFVASCF